MLKTYSWPRYATRRAPEIGQAGVRRVPLVVVGAGPVGLSAAIDAALRGLPAPSTATRRSSPSTCCPRPATGGRAW